MRSEAQKAAFYERNKNWVIIYILIGFFALCLALYGLITGGLSVSQRIGIGNYRTLGAVSGFWAFLPSVIFLCCTALSWKAWQGFRTGRYKVVFQAGVASLVLFFSNIIFIRVLIGF